MLFVSFIVLGLAIVLITIAILLILPIFLSLLHILDREVLLLIHRLLFPIDFLREYWGFLLVVIQLLAFAVILHVVLRTLGGILEKNDFVTLDALFRGVNIN